MLWPKSFTNIDQYQCHWIELFLQHYLTIYHKNYSHSRVPAATVAMVTTNQCPHSANSVLIQRSAPMPWAHLPIVHALPASICARPHLISFLTDLWPSPDLNPVDYRIWVCLQDHVYQKRTRDINEPTQCLWLMHGQNLGIIDEAIDECRKRLQACVRINDTVSNMSRKPSFLPRDAL